MLKTISICAALAVLGTGTVNAQQREAVLKKLEVPGADFDLVIAMPKAGSVAIEQHGLPDPLVVNLAGTELMMAVDAEAEKTFTDIDLLRAPACAFYVDHKNGDPSTSAAVYVVPRGEPSAAPVR